MSNCGGDCACSSTASGTQEASITVASDGKCPCGKPMSECCHAHDQPESDNDAIKELCEQQGDKNIC